MYIFIIFFASHFYSDGVRTYRQHFNEMIFEKFAKLNRPCSELIMPSTVSIQKNPSLDGGQLADQKIMHLKQNTESY